MSSFNVAQILPSLDSGGVERGTIEVANYLSELKLKNNIISNGGRLVNEINKNYTRHFELAVHSKNFFSYPTIANKLKKNNYRSKCKYSPFTIKSTGMDSQFY